MSKHRKSRKAKKGATKQQRQANLRNSTREDFHHLLYQRRHWQQGYAKLLRQHPYSGKYIPQQTLHRTIHSKIHDVPCPNGKECKAAYQHLLELERNGEIDIQNDSAEKRLDFFIHEWEETCPATVAILKWQKEIIHKFYSKQQ